MYVPYIIKSKILRENRKYFIISVFFYYFTLIILGIKANVVSRMEMDFRFYFLLPGIIYTIWAANLIIEHYNKIFGLDLYNSLAITKTCEEHKRLEAEYGQKGIAIVRNDILKGICDENEKLPIVIGTFAVASLVLISDYITGNIGKMYGLDIFPWSSITYWIVYFYSTIVMIPLLFSLFWLIITMLKGIKLIWSTYELKSCSPCSLLNIKPILDLIFLMSSLTIIFSIVYTLAVVYVSKINPRPFYYIFNFLVVGAGLAIFIWPQLSLHEELKNVKEKVLLKYYKIYEDKKNDYLDIISKGNENPTLEEIIKNDMLSIKDIITEAEKFDTWPFFSRIKRLIGAGLGTIIIMLLQALKII